MKKLSMFLILLLLIGVFLLGCNKQSLRLSNDNQIQREIEDEKATDRVAVNFTEEMQELEDGFSVIKYSGEYGFDKFLIEGGAQNDGEVVEFLSKNLLSGEKFLFNSNLFGCSTLAVKNFEGEALFGRNFDWEKCNALVVKATPEASYASISTVNMDFVTGYSSILEQLPDQLKTIAALYAPMDGMNDQGLCVAVLMIQDSASINQSTQKPGITTTTAVRLLLDKAANVDEAIALLQQYDMNASMDMMVHFAISDGNGKSVVVEYINNEMTVVNTPVATNFYLAAGEKKGIGTAQSHDRYDILMKQLEQTPIMDTDGVRDSLNRVSKDNFNEFESTEWSIVYNQTKGIVHYYHREDYDKGYSFNLFN